MAAIQLPNFQTHGEACSSYDVAPEAVSDTDKESLFAAYFYESQGPLTYYGTSFGNHWPTDWQLGLEKKCVFTREKQPEILGAKPDENKATEGKIKANIVFQTQSNSLVRKESTLFEQINASLP